jgi:integrase
VGRRPTNNPRQLPSKACGCPACTAKFRPTEKPTRRDCTGSWQYRYDRPDGRETSVTRPTRDEAIAAGEKARVQIREDDYQDPKRGNITLNQWWDLWRDNLEGGERHLALQESFWRNHLQPKFGAYRLRSITYREVQAWVNKLGERSGLEPRSAAKAFHLLNLLLAAAVRDDRVKRNVCEGVKVPRPAPKHPEERRPPTYAQLWLIRQKLPKHYHALQIVAQETGLRWGEVTGLRASWVDLDARRIYVREVLVRHKATVVRKPYPKSSAGLRTVPLTGLAYRVLKDHMEQRQPAATRSSPADGLCPEELVFVAYKRRSRGEPALLPMTENTFSKTWVRAIKAAGVARVKVKELPDGRVRHDYWPTFHSQRHAFASRCHARGIPEALVQEILGHERAGAVTWLYTHAAADYAGQVLAALTLGQPGRRRLRSVSDIGAHPVSIRNPTRPHATAG